MKVMQKFFEKAIEFDMKRDVKQSIEWYQHSIVNNENREEAYSNLIVLLIEINFDYGVNSSLVANNIIKQEEMLDLYKLLNRLLNDAIEKYKNISNEFEFWKYYCETYYIGYDRNNLLFIIEKNENNLIPYFYLYINDLASSIPTNHYKAKIAELKKILFNIHSSKNRYIKSLLDSSEFIYNNK